MRVSYYDTMKYKQRIFVIIVTISIFLIFLTLFDWDSPNITCLKYYTAIRSKCCPFGKFPKFRKTDNFHDIEATFLLQRNSKNLERFEKVIIQKEEEIIFQTIADVADHIFSENATNYEKFQYSISNHGIYKESDPLIPNLLLDLATLPIVNVTNKIYGTQFKLNIEYSNGMMALFKPMRCSRETQTLPDHFYFQDFERHNSEIAAFHLDRALNFRRVLPTIGRKINMTSELYDIAEPALRKTFFRSETNNICLWGNCTYYCSIFEPVCGEGDVLEGSFQVYLPQFEAGYLWERENPWKRGYAFRKIVKWENTTDYCDEVRNQPLYTVGGGRLLLDVMDMSILDFIMGNLDRHHYEYFMTWGNDSSSVYIDNGRGFGKPFYDDMSILTPIIQCCLIRESTLKTLLRFHNGPKSLSQVMWESLSEDPLTPVLWEPHFTAMDRRVDIILQEIRKCLNS